MKLYICIYSKECNGRYCEHKESHEPICIDCDNYIVDCTCEEPKYCDNWEYCTSIEKDVRCTPVLVPEDFIGKEEFLL